MFCDFLTASNPVDLEVWVMKGCGATDSFLRDAGWGSGGTLHSPNSRATPQVLDERSKIESVNWRLEPKQDLRRGSEAGRSRWRWWKSCRCQQMLQEEFLWLSCLAMIIVRDCNHGSKSKKAHSIKDVVRPFPLSTGKPGGIGLLKLECGKCDSSSSGTGCDRFQQWYGRESKEPLQLALGRKAQALARVSACSWFPVYQQEEGPFEIFEMALLKRQGHGARHSWERLERYEATVPKVIWWIKNLYCAKVIQISQKHFS